MAVTGAGQGESRLLCQLIIVLPLTPTGVLDSEKGLSFVNCGLNDIQQRRPVQREAPENVGGEKAGT